MRFENIRFNENLITRMDGAVKEQKISHAYILEGSACIDKQHFAECFIKGILCPKNHGENCSMCSICNKIDHHNHEDLIYISAQGSSIKDADIINMQDRLKTRPFGDRNIVIIADGDTMTIRAQNRLLKTLEEPPGNSVIIILSENMENLIPTVQSRCVKYRINYFGSENYDSMMESSEKIAKMALNKKPFYQLKKETDTILGDPDEVAAFLDSLQVIYRNIMVDKKRGISLYKDRILMDHIYAVEDARRQIKEGVSTAYAVKNLLLKIGG